MVSRIDRRPDSDKLILRHREGDGTAEQWPLKYASYASVLFVSYILMSRFLSGTR